MSARAITPRNPALAEEARKAGVTSLPAMPRFPALLAPSREAALRTTGHVDLLVLLIDYEPPMPIQPGTEPPEFYESLAFDPSGKSMKTYYDENSYSALDLGGAVEGWFRSTLPYSYFVNADTIPGTPDDNGFDTSPNAYNPATDPYPRNVWGIVMEAVALADAAVDFSEFDGDNDGAVDALCIVHAGAGAEEVFAGSEDYIWSHKSNLTDYLTSIGRQPLATNDGVTIGDYFMAPATGTLGVYCHEFGHMFGLPDLYRTDSETREQSSIVGAFDLMDYGAWVDGGMGRTPSHLGAWCKYELGWIAPTAVSLEAGGIPEIENAQLFASASANPEGAFYRLLPNPGGTDWTPRRVGSGEYFLIENRVAGNANFDEFLAASGLAIWHVDERRPNNNSTDANDHLLTLVQADGEDWRAFTGAARGEPTDLWPGGRSDPNFTVASEPSSRLHNGAFSGVEIREIRQLGEVIEADLSANAVRFGSPYAYPNPLKMEEGGEAEIAFTFEPNARTDPDLAAPPVIVQIFDLSGALVRTIRAESGPAVWDCRNDGGNMVASGTYFYRIQADRETADGKIVILH